MKPSLVESATVFCISSNGVMEGHHFLTLISWHAAPIASRNGQRRSRTFSLPPSLDKLPNYWDDDRHRTDFVKLTSSGRSLSDGILKISRQQSKSAGVDCLSVSKLCDSLKRVNSRKIDTGIGKRADKQKHVGDTITICVSSKPKMHKSLVRRRKPDNSPTCSAVSFNMDGYMLSYFIGEMRRSSAFRSLFMHYWSKGGSSAGLRDGYPLLIFVARLKKPNHEVLDLLGNKMVNSNILYRRSLEHALSWLSTLGGAFSALGDLSSSWAEEAGHVSLTQLRIAMKLDDPGIQSRCRLYAAISLLQRGYLKSCRDIVRQEYQYAMSIEESDPRLRRMCLGVWSKLQYHWKLVTQSDKRLLKSSLDGLEDIRNNAKYRNVYNLEEGRKIASPEDSKLS